MITVQNSFSQLAMVSGHTGLAWPGLASLASFMSINGYINTAPEYIGSSFHPFFLNHGVQVKCGISHISNKILNISRTDLTDFWTIGHLYFKPFSSSVLPGRLTVLCRGSTHGGLLLLCSLVWNPFVSEETILIRTRFESLCNRHRLSVCLSVSLSVCNKSSHTSHH